jgi:cytochrome c-type biogenesis protein CcmH
LRRAVLPRAQWSKADALVTADALTRHDQYAEAAAMLLSATRADPRDGEAWLALGNNLAAAADGAVTPAARLAYRRAEAAAPQSPGVPFFVGVQQLEAGNLLDARRLWAEASARAPQDSEARQVIDERIARLDAVVQRLQQMQGQPE